MCVVFATPPWAAPCIRDRPPVWPFLLTGISPWNPPGGARFPPGLRIIALAADAAQPSNCRPLCLSIPIPQLQPNLPLLKWKSLLRRCLEKHQALDHAAASGSKSPFPMLSIRTVHSPCLPRHPPPSRPRPSTQSHRCRSAVSRPSWILASWFSALEGCSRCSRFWVELSA